MNSKILVIYSNFDKDGYNKEILKNTLDFLEKEKKDYKLLDLYKMNYNPVLDDKEIILKKGKNYQETLKIQKDIKERDILIFIYPIWWGTMPAILKGFIDRTFTAGFAYKYVNSIPRGLLKGKKAFIFSTSGVRGLYNKITYNKYTRGLRKDVLRFCGISSKSIIIGKALNIKKKNEKEKIKKIVYKKLNNFL